MNNSNIIVSIIIVLSIAAGVTVYGLNEGDNAVFSDLTGFTPASSDSGSNGLGDLISNDSNQQNSGSSGGSQTPTKISSSQAKSIASGFIEEDGAYVSNVKDDGSMYICYISDANGEVVDAIGISYSGENLGKV